MPARPCTPESGAVNDFASAHVAGHGHRFRLGVDQPDYLRLLRFFDSFARAVLHASVTRRAAYYGFHRQLVSIRLASGSDNAAEDGLTVRSEDRSAPSDPPHGGDHGAFFRELHARTLENRSWGSQLVGEILHSKAFQGVPGRDPGCRKPPPEAVGGSSPTGLAGVREVVVRSGPGAF